MFYVILFLLYGLISYGMFHHKTTGKQIPDSDKESPGFVWTELYEYTKDWMLLGLLIWVALGGILGYFFIPAQEYVYSKENLYALTDVSGYQEDDFLLVSHAQDTFKFRYAVKEDNAIKIKEESNRNNVSIIEDSSKEPSIVKYKNELRPSKPSDFWFFFHPASNGLYKILMGTDVTEKTCIFVPEGTVANNYAIDLDD